MPSSSLRTSRSGRRKWANGATSEPFFNSTSPISKSERPLCSGLAKDGAAGLRLAPWQREGWFAGAIAWISSKLPDVTEVEQYRVWSGSALLHALGGRYFFKGGGHLSPGARRDCTDSDRFPEVYEEYVPVS